MAYNAFPATYQNAYYQPQMIPQMQQAQPQQPQVPAQQNNPMIWVQGETGAKSYLLAPNTTLPLWDSESQTIYLKSTDASGMPSMKILDYTIRDLSSPNVPIQNQAQAAQQQPDYVTHEELTALKKEIIEEVKSYEQHNTTHANGHRTKKQPDGDTR